MTDRRDYLIAYDQQLRTDAETPSAVGVTLVGSIRLVKFARGRGFVTYPPLHGAEAEQAPQLVAQVLDHYRQDPEITRVEWKTRGHDRIPGMHDALLGSGFVAQESESIMIGRAEVLDVEVAVPAAVKLRQIRDEDDLRAMALMEDQVFDRKSADETMQALFYRLASAMGWNFGWPKRKDA